MQKIIAMFKTSKLNYAAIGLIGLAVYSVSIKDFDGAYKAAVAAAAALGFKEAMKSNTVAISSAVEKNTVAVNKTTDAVITK